MDKGTPDISSAIGKLLENPDALQNAMKIAAQLKQSGALEGLFGGIGNGTEEEKSAEKSIRQTAEYTEDDRSYTERADSKDGIRDGQKREEGRENSPDGSRTKVMERREEQGENAQRKQLLAALRPYMSRERQEKIDTVLHIFQLLETAERLGVVKARHR